MLVTVGDGRSGSKYPKCFFFNLKRIRSLSPMETFNRPSAWLKSMIFANRFSISFVSQA